MHELKSTQLDDEESSKYLINYLSSDESESTDLTDQYSIDDDEEENNHHPLTSLPSTLIVTPVPQELFTDGTMKVEFENLFRSYDLNIVVLYLKFFQRVRITFSSSSNALQARLHLHEYPFHGTMMKTYFACPIAFRGANPETYLRPPEPEKLFLISPPTSPPVGWEQKLEDPPVVDLNLIAAIAQLEPNQSHELLPREHGSKTPAIIIHTCDDGNQPTDLIRSARLIKPSIIQTKRPPAQN